MPVFAGRRNQRGHGLGNILGGLFKRVVGLLGSRGMQFLKQNRQAAVSNLLKTGLNVVDDVARGKKVKESLKARVPEAIKKTAQELQFQSGDEASKTKHRPPPLSAHRRKATRRRVRNRDIFA